MVAFLSTRYRGSAGRLAPFVPQVLFLGCPGACSPRKFLLFGLSKMQFLALSESELVKLDGLLRH